VEDIKKAIQETPAFKKMMSERQPSKLGRKSGMHSRDPQLQEYLDSLTFEEAFNLAGGHSPTFVHRGKTFNVSGDGPKATMEDAIVEAFNAMDKEGEIQDDFA
tara:strand:- start:4847 stop:5155 length:309 start_codon:yes stop_codon:yes gene_type:complete